MGPYYSTLLRLEEEELIEYCLATDKCVLRGGENVKEDFPMVYSIGIFHYVTAITIIVDSIIFMSGFSPFFITKLTPTVYNLLLIYCISVGTLLYCRAKPNKQKLCQEVKRKAEMASGKYPHSVTVWWVVEFP